VVHCLVLLHLIFWIAYRLGRKVKWDAKAGTFPGDAQAQAMMSKKYRVGCELPVV
jgi:hypothetical protein